MLTRSGCVEWDTRNEQQTEERLRQSNVMRNLVGRDHETVDLRLSPLGIKI